MFGFVVGLMAGDAGFWRHILEATQQFQGRQAMARFARDRLVDPDQLEPHILVRLFKNDICER